MKRVKRNIRPEMIVQHTQRVFTIIRKTLQAVLEDAEELYQLRWVDMSLVHVTHGDGLVRRMQLRWPTNMRPSQRSAELALCLRHLQLMQWQIYQVQNVLPLGDPRVEMDWVWTAETPTPASTP